MIYPVPGHCLLFYFYYQCMQMILRSVKEVKLNLLGIELFTPFSSLSVYL